MAKKRMISLQITDTDAFLDMPLSTQALYFHLVTRADDEGFISNPKRIMKLIGCQEDDMKILIGKRFVLSFESGVVVIKHWLIHNNIRADRFIETAYPEEKKLLKIKENKAYTENDIPNGNQMATTGMHRLDKIRLDKNSTSAKFTEQDIQVANILRTLIKENLPTFKNPNIETWAVDINKLHRIDKYNYDQIEFIIRWCQKDNFWQSNILSASKLRKQFIQLIAHAKRGEKKEDKNRVRLHDGNYAIKKFNNWYSERQPDVKIDLSYYPELRKIDKDNN